MGIINRDKTTIRGLESDLIEIHERITEVKDNAIETLPNNDKLYVRVNNEWKESGDFKDPETGDIISDLGFY